MSMFTLPISYLTTSNFPWFMDLRLHVPMQYCSIQHRTLLPSPVTSTTGCCFCFGSVSPFFLELFFHWSPVVYWGVHFSVSNLFAFSYCLWGSQGKNTEVVCHSLLQWIIFCQNSAPWPIHLGWPYTAWLSFIELARLWSMWSDWLVFCDCGFHSDFSYTITQLKWGAQSLVTVEIATIHWELKCFRCMSHWQLIACLYIPC